jgi:hypothetical protein
MKKIIVLIVSFIVMSTAAVAEEYERIEQCINEKDSHCLFSISLYKDMKSKSIYSASSDSGVDVLKKYYNLAKKNKSLEIIDLYSAKDGSKEIVKKQLKRNPNTYARFNKIADVKILMSARMGDYYSYKVEWLSDKGDVLTRWLELVHCPDSCYMSSRVLEQSEESYFYAIATSLKSMTGVSNEINTNYVEVNVPEKSKFPVSMKISTIHNVDFPSSLKRDELAIRQFILSLKASFSQLIDDSGQWKEKIEALVAFFNSYWVGVNPQSSFQLPDVGESETRFPLRNIWNFSTKLENVKSFTSAFSIPGKNVNFHMLKLKFESSVSYAIFVVDHSGMLTPRVALNGLDGELAEMIYHPYVYSELVGKAKEIVGDANDLITDDLSPYKVLIDISAKSVVKTHISDEIVSSNDEEVFNWYDFTIGIFGFLFFGLVAVIVKKRFL